MATWSETAQKILDGMNRSGVNVSRKLIAPGPAAGRRCSQFLVYPDFPSAPSQGFPTLAATPCARIETVQFRAVYTDDCAPKPKDNAEQPDARATTRWSKAYLDNCQKVLDGIIDEFGGCDGLTMGPGQFTGPANGVASMSLAIQVNPTVLT